jgi:TQXA domain-containing protein
MRTAKPVATLAVIVAALSLAAPALAEVVPAPPTGTKGGSNTELTFTSLGPGQGVTGFIANASNPFDPVKDGYPASNPTSGFTPHNLGFAGILHGTPTGGGAQLSLYCIDIHTETNIGIGYELGTWDAATVPNVGYVARLLNSYFPTVPTMPPGLPNDSQRAAATQAAIWFFTDRYVLSTSDGLHNTVAAITAAVIAAGPLDKPDPPSLVIAPPSISGPQGSAVGPFTVTSTVDASVTALGATMYRDAAATQPIADGDTVASGTPIWMRSTGPQAAVLHATAQATVPTGNVYLYDGNTPGKERAQKLILAQTATLKTTVNAEARFLTPGSLVVSKSISGGAAGQQEEVTISVSCDGTALPDFVIPAGTTGTPSHTYEGLAAGARCTVTETDDGTTPQVTVVVVGSGQEVTIPGGGVATATLSDTYSLRPGALLVRKTIAGAAAGQQGAVTIAVTCNGTALEPFIIPAGTPGGTTEKLYADILAGQVCTITETGNGATSAVSVTVVGSGQQVSVPAGELALADVIDTYDYRPGSLTVTKTIAGTGAGQQGEVTITVTCNGVIQQPQFVIPANTPAGERSQTYEGIPGNATCTVIETADGSNPSLAVIKAGSGERVVIPPGGTASAGLTDTYLTGSLVVNKTITGDAAGQQGNVTITVECPGLTFDPFIIPAGTPAGTESEEFTGILAGAVCTVNETGNGTTGSTTITVTTEGSPQDVTIGPGGTGTANVTDTYEFVPGSLVVNKPARPPASRGRSRSA